MRTKIVVRDMMRNIVSQLSKNGVTIVEKDRFITRPFSSYFREAIKRKQIYVKGDKEETVIALSPYYRMEIVNDCKVKIIPKI